MKLTLKEWLDVQHMEEWQALEEKLIMYNNGKPYGQIVFLAGGAGSGKGFAIQNFMEKNKFKVRDVDEWKQALITLAREKGRNPELAKLDLRNPNDVFKLHDVVKKLGIKEKSLDLLLSDLKKDRLPNIIFDITLKDMGDITDVLPKLIEVGYEAKNVHLAWVLTNYAIAVKANAARDRVVPDDILLKTHMGAANTMKQVLQGKTPAGLDGKVVVILNNRDQTVFFDTPNAQGEKVLKSFTYVTLKKEGKPFEKESAVQAQIYNWMKDNIPKADDTKDLFK